MLSTLTTNGYVIMCVVNEEVRDLHVFPVLEIWCAGVLAKEALLPRSIGRAREQMICPRSVSKKTTRTGACSTQSSTTLALKLISLGKAKKISVRLDNAGVDHDALELLLRQVAPQQGGCR